MTGISGTPESISRVLSDNVVGTPTSLEAILAWDDPERSSLLRLQGIEARDARRERFERVVRVGHSVSISTRRQ